MKEYLETSSCRDAISKFLDEAAMLTDELSQLHEVNINLHFNKLKLIMSIM